MQKKAEKAVEDDDDCLFESVCALGGVICLGLIAIGLALGIS